MGFITTVNISCVQRNRKEKGGTNGREREGGREGERRNQRERGREGGREGEGGKRERRARREKKEVWNRERKGGRKCIILDDTCVSVVLDRHPCCLPYRWHSYSSAVASLHSSVWLAHAGYHLMNGGGKRYKQMVGERLLLEGMVTCA